MHCLFCDEDTILYNENSKYDQCQKCKTLLANNGMVAPVYDSDKLMGTYPWTIFINGMKSDLNHYKNMNKQKQFIDFKNKYKFNTIYSFGGGYPKLETFLNASSFISLDIIAEIYEVKKNEFINVYSMGDRKFEIIKAFIDGDYIKSIKYNEDDLLSFVHILEHFNQKDMLDILDSIPINQMVLVYGPEGSKATHKGQLHFKADEHLTLFSINQLAGFVTQRYKANIICKEQYADDMFMVFVKK